MKTITLLLTAFLTSTTFAAGFLGVQLTDVTSEMVDEHQLPAEYGAHVVSTLPNSPAATAGLQAHDTIVDYNGQRVESAATLQRLVKETPPGRNVEMGIVREGDKTSLSAVIGQNSFSSIPPAWGQSMPFGFPPQGLMPPQEEKSQVDTIPIPEDAPKLGAHVTAVHPQLAQYLNIDSGLLVEGVQDDSRAARAGLKTNDILLTINDKDILHAQDITRQLLLQTDEPVDLLVLRDGEQKTLHVQPVVNEGDEPDGEVL